MAVQVKVHREISDFQPKVFASMTVRQLKAFVFFLVPALAVFAGAWFLLGSPPGEWAQWIAVVGVVPMAVYGWVRPMGLDFEEYAVYWRAHHMGRRRFAWAAACPECVAGIEHGAGMCEARRPRAWASSMDLKSRKVRRDVAVFEATH